MSLTPQQREQLSSFVAELHELSRFERHFRRTDRLLVVAAATTAVLMVFVANVSDDGLVRAVAVSLLFPLGSLFGATLVGARNRRRSFGQIAALGEIAELTLLYEDEDA